MHISADPAFWTRMPVRDSRASVVANAGLMSSAALWRGPAAIVRIPPIEDLLGHIVALKFCNKMYSSR